MYYQLQHIVLLHMFTYCVITYVFVLLLLSCLFRTVPDAVRNLVVSDRSNSSLTVGWDVRADGVLSGYGVTVKGDGTPQTQNPDRDTTTHEFTGLTAGTEYIVSVLTVSGDQQSAKVEDKFYTSKCKFW